MLFAHGPRCKLRGVNLATQRQIVKPRSLLWPSLALVVLFAASVVGCSFGSPSATNVDFIGEVVSADVTGWSAKADPPDIAFSTGGIDSRLRVGPATFNLADGTTIDVPAETPGGNLCSLLGYRDQPRTPTCLVAGEVDATGAAEWFAIQPLDRSSDGSSQLTVDRFDGRDAIVLIGGIWLAMPVPPDATLTCSESGDLSSTPLDVPSRSALVTLNAALEIDGVHCLYSE